VTRTAAAAQRNATIKICGTAIAPGSRATVDLPVADLYTHASLAMPVQVINGRRRGPVLFLSAAVHGDEICGVEIIRRLLKRKILRSIRGTLLAVPVVNVHGFLDQSRYLPDRRDLNRSFPGSPKGSVAARLAHVFASEIVAKADYGIDLHTGAVHRGNLPPIRANLDDENTLHLARAFGTPILINSDLRDGSLREHAASRGIPMLLYEAGEALRFDEIGIRAGIRGILNVMRAISMLPPKNKPSRVADSIIARQTSWVRASQSGMVNSTVRLGQRVAKGQTLATIADPFGESESSVMAPFAGVVIGRNNLPLAHEGDALFHVAAVESARAAQAAVEKFTTHHDPTPTEPTG
jgi:predicted deacylase